MDSSVAEDRFPWVEDRNDVNGIEAARPAPRPVRVASTITPSNRSRTMRRPRSRPSSSLLKALAVVVGTVLTVSAASGPPGLGAPAPAAPPIRKILLLERGQVGTSPIAGEAQGAFGVSYDPPTKKLRIEGAVQGVSSGPSVPSESGSTTAAHLRHAPVGRDGTFVHNLVVTLPAGGGSGSINGEFTLTDDEGKWLLSENMYVVLFTEDNPNGELRGQILRGSLTSPPCVDDAALSKDEREAAEKARTGVEFPSALFQSYQDKNKYPILPLSHSTASGKITDDDPFPAPGLLEAHPEFRDKRDPSDLDRDDKLRYLRRAKPQGVESDGTITGTDRQSFFDHPRVQPRPPRSLHYRFCVDNDLIQTKIGTVSAMGLRSPRPPRPINRAEASGSSGRSIPDPSTRASPPRPRRSRRRPRPRLKPSPRPRPSRRPRPRPKPRRSPRPNRMNSGPTACSPRCRSWGTAGMERWRRRILIRRPPSSRRSTRSNSLRGRICCRRSTRRCGTGRGT